MTSSAVPSLLRVLPDGDHYATRDGRLILRDDETNDTIAVYDRIYLHDHVLAVRLGRCGESYGKDWRALYLALDRTEKAWPIRRRACRAIILDVSSLSAAIPPLMRLRLRHAVRGGAPVRDQLEQMGFRSLGGDGWYRLDLPPALSLLCRLVDGDPRERLQFYQHSAMLSWPPDDPDRIETARSIRIRDLAAYHEYTEGESTPEVPSKLMPRVHFHTTGGGIVCDSRASHGLIDYGPERPEDFGYGYFE